MLTRGKQAGAAESAEVARAAGPDSASRWGRGAPKEGHRADSWPHHTWPAVLPPEGPPRPAGARAGAGGAGAAALLSCPRLHGAGGMRCWASLCLSQRQQLSATRSAGPARRGGSGISASCRLRPGNQRRAACQGPWEEVALPAHARSPDTESRLSRDGLFLCASPPICVRVWRA